VDTREIIYGLEDRLSALESRNNQLEDEHESHSKELQDVRHRLSSITEERDRLSEQVLRLKSIVASEGSAGKVLARTSISAPSSDLKLEIYKQQILILNEELDKLRPRQ